MTARIQLRRTRGWRKPEGAVVVARPSKWGNPHRMTGATFVDRLVATQLFRRDITAAINHPWDHPHAIEFRVIAESLPELRGRDLACWCPLDQPCHADVLLDLANRKEAP